MPSSFYMYVFIIALSALLVSHSSAAPTSTLPTVGKELIKHFVSSRFNIIEQAEAETRGRSIGNQVHLNALIQMGFGGVGMFFDSINEATVEDQQYSAVKAHMNSIGGAPLGMIPTLASTLQENVEN